MIDMGNKAVLHSASIKVPGWEGDQNGKRSNNHNYSGVPRMQTAQLHYH